MGLFKLRKHKVASYAKINLYLDILQRFTDGYHEINTLMVPVGLCDDSTFYQHSEKGLKFTCSDPLLPTDEGNLVVRALRELESYVGKSFDVNIHLDKHIPYGSGLGSASSNAAVTVMTLNEMFQLGLNKECLGELLSKISMDATFFLHQGAAWCTGRGEKITPISQVVGGDDLLITLVVPNNIQVNTKWAYESIDRKLLTPPGERVMNVPPGETLVLDLSNFKVYNFFEKVIFPHYPVLHQVKELLLKVGAQQVGLSGSGSALYGLFDNQDLAQKFLDQLKFKFPKFKVFKVKLNTGS